MTAKEIIDKYQPSILSGTQVERYGQVAIQKMMKEYAKQKCGEQREICAECMKSETDKRGRTLLAPAHDAILDAPEPKFD